jgi:hypothetical protein
MAIMLTSTYIFLANFLDLGLGECHAVERDTVNLASVPGSKVQSNWIRVTRLLFTNASLS